VSEAVVSDEDLLGGARSGNAQALEDLLERHQAQVYRFGGQTLALCRTSNRSTPVPPAVQASVRVALLTYLTENA